MFSALGSTISHPLKTKGKWENTFLNNVFIPTKHSLNDNQITQLTHKLGKNKKHKAAPSFLDYEKNCFHYPLFPKEEHIGAC